MLDSRPRNFFKPSPPGLSGIAPASLLRKPCWTAARASATERCKPDGRAMVATIAFAAKLTLGGGEEMLLAVFASPKREPELPLVKLRAAPDAPR